LAFAWLFGLTVLITWWSEQTAIFSTRVANVTSQKTALSRSLLSVPHISQIMKLLIKFFPIHLLFPVS
jgi:hypothetical protein